MQVPGSTELVTKDSQSGAKERNVQINYLEQGSECIMRFDEVNMPTDGKGMYEGK